jgi:hypothetical protein
VLVLRFSYLPRKQICHWHDELRPPPHKIWYVHPPILFQCHFATFGACSKTLSFLSSTVLSSLNSRSHSLVQSRFPEYLATTATKAATKAATNNIVNFHPFDHTHKGTWHHGRTDNVVAGLHLLVHQRFGGCHEHHFAVWKPAVVVVHSPPPQ